MKRSLLLIALAGCWRSTAPESVPPAPASALPVATSVRVCPWFLLERVYQCADIRSGFSGYYRLRIVDGPRAGVTVVAYYGEAARSQVGAWSLSKTIEFSTSTDEPASSTRWPNSCGIVLDSGTLPRPAAPPPTESGFIHTWEKNQVEAFEDEATARAALATRC